MMTLAALILSAFALGFSTHYQLDAWMRRRIERKFGGSHEGRK